MCRTGRNLPARRPSRLGVLLPLVPRPRQGRHVRAAGLDLRHRAVRLDVGRVHAGLGEAGALEQVVCGREAPLHPRPLLPVVDAGLQLGRARAAPLAVDVLHVPAVQEAARREDEQGQPDSDADDERVGQVLRHG